MTTLVSLFCYVFFAGIALSMAAPAARPWWPWVVALAALAASGAAWSVWRMRRIEDDITLLRSPMLPRVFRVLLCLAALASGFARHAATFDERGLQVGVLTPPCRFAASPLKEGGDAREMPPSLRGDAPEGQGGVLRAIFTAGKAAAPARLHAIRRLPGSGSDAVDVWVEGDQIVLRPVRDDDGTPLLDGEGRWRFREYVRRRVTSRATLPEGATEVVLPEPFSAIHSWGVEGSVLNAPALELVRLPSRTGTFAAERPENFKDAATATILGRVADDPDVYNATEDATGESRRRTVLDIEPWFIQPAPGEPFYPVEGGHVQVTLSAVADAAPGGADAEFNAVFDALSRTSAVGNDVVLRGSLEIPQSAKNPGGFDNRKFLLSHGFEAQMYLQAWQRMHGPPAVVVTPEGAAAPRSGNPIVVFSLRLRDRMLGVIKRTLPYPASAFAGGITLGMRHGMQDARCALGPATDCADTIPDEFKRAGVNHVLAVSGLHVTIITAMLVGVFTLFGLGRKAYVPLVLAALVVFAIITGARPSTLRAVIMNGLFLVVWAYLGESLKSSVLLAAAVAGFLIMMQNPRLLVDPSFTLSFGAVLSLGLLTGPCSNVLACFRGNDLMSLGVCVVGFHVALLGGWFRVAAPRSALCLVALAAAVSAFGRLLARRGVRPIGEYGFADLPVAVGGFLSAQGAIQLGMMIPLSAYYFSRWPVIGSVANLVAIPLIGVVLQLSMLACLIGLVPVVGPVVALVLNAANSLGCLLFMAVSHVASSAFPYPFVRRPSGAAVGVYYALLALFVLWPRVREVIDVFLHPMDGAQRKQRRVAFGLACAAIAAVCAAVWPRAPRADGSTHVSALSVGYGSAVLVRAPDGRATLVDAGYVRRDGARSSQAERSVLPRLSALGIRRLDALVVLSARPERLDGAALVLEQCLVDRLVLPPALAACFDPATNEVIPERLDAALPPNSTDIAIMEAREAILGPADGVHRATNPSLAAVLRARRPSTLNRLLGIAVRIEGHGNDAGKHTSIARNSQDGPASAAVVSVSSVCDIFTGERASVARIGAPGGAAMLLCGDCADLGALAALVEADPAVRAVSVPCHGTLDRPADAEPLFQALAARDGVAVFEYGAPRAVLKRTRPAAARNYRATLALAESILGADHVRSTDRDGAVELELR